MTQQQIVLTESNGKPLIEMKDNGPTFMQLLAVAIENKSAIDVIERLAALREKEMAQRALLDFNEALCRVQKEIKRIAPDEETPDKKKKWASYSAIDRIIRPIYSGEGFSLSFSDAECPKPEHIRIVCRVSRGGHVERPFKDWPIDTKGPKGGDLMTLGDATGSADSRAKRFLIKDIFNIAVGRDEEEGGNQMDQDELKDRLAYFAKLQTITEVFEHFKSSYLAAEEAGDIKAQIALSEAKDNRKKEIQDARAKS